MFAFVEGDGQTENRVTGVIWEVHGVKGPDPTREGIMEGFLEEVTEQRPEGRVGRTKRGDVVRDAR